MSVNRSRAPVRSVLASSSSSLCLLWLAAAAGCTNANPAGPGTSTDAGADAGLVCENGVSPCGEVCCTAGQECVEGACLPACASGVRCGAGLATCCGDNEECKEGVCTPKCIPDCKKPGGTGVRDCGDDGCGGQCPPGCKPNEVCTAQGTCEIPVQTGNDTCDTAIALSFTGDTATTRGDTTGATSNTTFSCARRIAGLDVAYTFVLGARKKVTATVTPAEGSPIVPVVDIRTTCDTATTALTCAAAPGAGQAATTSLDLLPAGTYALWVSSGLADAAGAGAFTLTVTLADPDQPAPGNDACGAGATELAFTDGHATVSETTAWAANDTVGGAPCTGGDLAGPDVVYKIVVAQPSTLLASLSFDNTRTGNTAGLYLRASCGGDEATATNLACASARRSTSLAAYGLAAGTYYLFVDGTALLGEAFTLTVDLGAPAANDSCASGAAAIAIDTATGIGTASGDTTFAAADSQGAGQCGGSTHDLVYSLHLDQEKLVTLAVEAPTGSTYRPIVYVRAVCDDPNHGSVACGYPSGTSGTNATTRIRLAAGDWYVWVGGYLPTLWGAFTLTVTVQDIVLPPNDVCANAIEITLDTTSGKGSASGTTMFAVDDYHGTTCTGGLTTGPDLVYKVTLDEAASLTVTVTRDGSLSTIVPAVYVRTSCESQNAADEKACAKATSTTASVLMPSADATTYYIIVDGTSGTSGDFKLDVTKGPLVSNDTCATPEVIAIDTTTGVGTTTGNTSLAKNDDYGTCQSQAATSPDLVYSFTLAQDQAVAINVTPATGSTLKPAIFVRTACQTRSSQVVGGCIASATSASTDLSFTVLSAGTYFLFVDGTSAGGLPSTGAFTLTVTTTAAPPAPAGDTCATATALTLTATPDPTTTQATVTGDTTNARNDAQGVGYCANSNGGDLAYSFTLTAAQMVTATVTTDSTTLSYQPVVYIRSATACASGADTDQLACGASSLAGGVATATANSLPIGDYDVWVDGLTNGKFTLMVTATTPVAGPANDNCSAPTALSFTGTTATATGTTVGAQNDTRSAGGAGYGAAGGDVVYSFALTSTDPRRITASVAAGSGAPSGFRPVAIVRNQCGAIADLGAGQGTATTAATASVASANAGTYFVWVDTGGTTPAPGPFTLTVTVEVPNDQCTNYLSLTAGTPQAGDTTNATDQYGTTGGFSAVCATALGTTTDTDGPDLVYRYTTPSTSGNFTITVTPSATFDAIVWVTTGTNSCGQPASCIGLADAARSGGVETLSITGTTRTNYYIIVDSYQPSMSGSFTIQVQ